MCVLKYECERFLRGGRNANIDRLRLKPKSDSADKSFRGCYDALELDYRNVAIEESVMLRFSIEPFRTSTRAPSYLI
jgi:hypothetical protein